MPAKNDKPEPIDVILTGVRGSYLSLFKMTAVKQDDGTMGKPRFSGSFLLNKERDADQIQRLEKEIDRMIKETWKGKITRKGLKGVCLRDGEEKEDKDGYGPEVMFVSASTSQRFPIVDAKVVPTVEEDGLIYSGCYLDVQIRLWAQDNNWGKRINAEIRAVRENNRDPQTGEKGEPFGGGQAAEASEVFQPLDDDERKKNSRKPKNDWE